MKASLSMAVSGLVLTAAICAPGLAQTFQGAPAYGELQLRSGSEEAVIRAGGALSANLLDANCWGYIPEAPSLVVDYRGNGDLYLSAGSDEDTTMIVRAPDGSIRCDDDSAGGFNPGVRFSDAQRGPYDVWLGTYQAGVGYPAATLHASTTGYNTSNPFSTAPDPNLPADQRVRLRAGFENDPRSYTVNVGGDTRLEGLGSMCFGYADEAPDVAFRYRNGGAFPLYISMESDSDGVLAIQTPSGDMLCNDDAIGLNPGVHIATPEAGRYLIWTGHLSDTVGRETGTLSISEIGFNGQDNRLDLHQPALFGETMLESGFVPDPFVADIQAGGSVEAYQAIDESLVADGYCAGNFTREPTYELTYEAGSFPLFIGAESNADTTLAINGPDGSWFCDDDGGEGLNALVEFNNPASGVYDIYVGTFSSGQTSSAALVISELAGSTAGDSDSYGADVDFSLPAIFGDHRLEAGFLPDPYVIEVEAGGPLDADQSGVDSEEDWCAGNVTAAPTAELDWQGSGGQLSIYAESGSDTTLAVNLPDGRWVCNDDGGEGLNPSLQFDNALDGIYDIYVGTFSSSQVSATLSISEFDAPSD